MPHASVNAMPPPRNDVILTKRAVKFRPTLCQNSMNSIQGEIHSVSFVSGGDKNYWTGWLFLLSVGICLLTPN